MTQHKRKKEQRLPDRVMSTGAYPTAITPGYLDRDTRKMLSAGGREPTDYRDQLFASSATTRLERKDISSLIRSETRNLALCLLVTFCCATLTIASLYLLYFELATGALINITGQVVYGSIPLVWPLDPAFFTISTGFGLILTLFLMWLAVKRAAKIRQARNPEGRLL